MSIRSQQVYGLVRRRSERSRRGYLRTVERTSRMLRGAGIALTLLGALAILLFSLAYVELTQDLPAVEAIPAWMENLQPTRILDRSGEHVLKTLSVEGIERRYITIDQSASEHLPEALIRFTIAIEDPNFYTHSGFIYQFPGDGQTHTLAESVVSSILLQDEPDGPRHTLRTWILAAQITAQYGRDQVLEWYLNSTAYGHQAYGVEAAAQTYFGKPASQLNLAEAAVLVSVSRTPALNPIDAPEAAQANEEDLLESLLKTGAITQDEMVEALTTKLQFQTEADISSHGEQSVQIAPAFTNLVMEQLEQIFSRSHLERGGLDVYTTLDYNLQQQTTCAVMIQVQRASGEDDPDEASCEAAQLLPTLTDSPNLGDDVNASALLINPQNGQILSLVGETSPAGESTYLFSHPAGSLLTPFIYFTGFTHGMGPASLVWDIPDEDEDLNNIDVSAYHGPVRLRVAMVNDYLAPAASLLNQFGAASIWKTAETFGLNPANSNSLETQDEYGHGPLSLIETAQAFSVFADSGSLAGQSLGKEETLSASAVLKIVDTGGQVLLDWTQPQTSSVISSSLAYLMNSSLSDETARWPSLGHPNALEIGQTAGAKLGQTADGKDAWTVGYTPERLAVVWMGSSSGSSENSSSDTQIDIDLPAGLWHAILQYAIQDAPSTGWEQPSGVTSLEVCDPSGMLPSNACPNTINEIFLSGNEPTNVDSLYRIYQVNRDTGLLATVFTSPELVEDKVFMDVPASAQAWAQAAGIDLPPDQYDSIQTQTQPENVRVTEPSLFSVVNGEVTIRGTASGDDFALYRIQIGEGLNPQSWIQVGTDGTKAVKEGKLGTWDTTGLDGLYAIRLQVVSQDQRIETTTIQVTVDNTPPEIIMQYPQEGQVLTVEQGQILAFQVSASDAIGLDRVEWYVDGSREAIQIESPFSLPWEAQTGKHTLQVQVYDQAGNLSTSDEISFEVKLSK